MSQRDVRIGKALSWLLRHGAKSENIPISSDGYVAVADVLRHKSFLGCTLEDLRRIVATNSKQRFALKVDPTGAEYVRANQGHSLQTVTKLELTPILKPEEAPIVVHGTYRRNWESIKRTGLSRMNRQHVHFATGLPGEGGVVSGMRTTCDVYVYLDLARALKDGLRFFRSANGVVLCPGDAEGRIGREYFLKVVDARTGNEMSLLSKASRSSTRKMNSERPPFVCELCHVTLKDEHSRQGHLLGKKHQLAVHDAHLAEVKEKSSVFITGFPRMADKNDIVDFINGHGTVKDLFVGEKNRYVIVQFNDPNVAEKLLREPVAFMGKGLIVKPRRQRDNNHRPIETPDAHDWLEQLVDSLKRLPNLNDQISTFLSIVQPPGRTPYDSVCRDLQFNLRDLFPGCTVLPFGSTVTGLHFKTSDVDAYVIVPYGMTSSAAPPPATNAGESPAEVYVRKARNALFKYRTFTNVISIPKAKTPIVRCVHAPTRTNCDFNFKNMLGVCNTRLIRYYLNAERNFLPTMLILKCWAKVHGVVGYSGKLSNYALALMFIFYVQQRPYFHPPVAVLQRDPTFDNIQEGWNGGFDVKYVPVKPYVRHGVDRLLLGFFEYYSRFEFAAHVICPYLGTVILKSAFADAKSLPRMFERYKRNVVEMDPLQTDTPICVQDPFEQNHNTTRAVAARTLEDFISLCRHAADIFRANQPYQLYKLLSEDADEPKQQSSETSVIVKLTMGPNLGYLKKDIKEEDKDNLAALQTAWFATVNKFVVTVMMSVFKFDVTVIPDDTTNNKSQKLSGQSDVHDKTSVDKVTLLCKGGRNLWSARRPIQKDLTFDDTVATNLDREIFVSEYISSVILKDVEPKDAVISFNLTMRAVTNPTAMQIELKKISDEKNCFKTFGAFFASSLPKWFGKEERERNGATVGDDGS